MSTLLDAMRAQAGEFVAVRRDLHRHPELAFEEHCTAPLVADQLEQWGYTVERGLGGTGVGGRGAIPHRAADPVVAAASLVMALQTVVSRNVNPLQAAVVTVGALHAGRANNVIPTTATLELSVRALDRDVRALLEARIRALAAAQAESFGVQARVDWRPGYAVLVNTPRETAFARDVALDLLGPERVTLQGPPRTGSEDVAFMLERVPGSHLPIGNGVEGDGRAQSACMVHHPGYDFHDDDIAVGSAFWVRLAERFLSAEGPPPLQ